MATRPGSRTPRPRRRTESTMEYTAVVIATPIASERIAKTVKSGVAQSRLRASLMSLTTRGSVASLVAQGHKWIHSDGPARGHECGGDADDCRNGRDGHKRHRVDVRAIHVHAADPDVRRSGRRAQREHDQDREDETDAGRHADQPRHPSVDAPDQLLTPGAERHPNADLARPPRDRERDDRIETDSSQQPVDRSHTF